MAVDLEALGITKEDLIERMAEKLIEEYCDTQDICDKVRNCINSHVVHQVESRLSEKVDQALSVAMANILEMEVAPRSIWGEKLGDPTTIKAALSERARVYWTEKVDASGRPTSYGGEMRAEMLMKQCVSSEFNNAIKANINAIIIGFREALHANASKQVAEHISSLINIPNKK